MHRYGHPETRRQTLANIAALASFVVASTVLLVLVRWTWRNIVAPHIELVQCVPTEGVVVGQRMENAGTGASGFVFPRAVYRYEFAGRSIESDTIRHPNYTRTNAGEERGEVRFFGPNRVQLAEAYLQQYPAGKKITVWVNPAKPEESMLIRQELDISPFLLGLLPGLFVPFFWMFFVLALHGFVGSPESRWATFGWGVLTLASLTPLFRQYQQLLDATDDFARLQNVGLGLAFVSVAASLSMQSFRSGMAIGLILCFTFIGGLGAVGAATTGQLQSVLGWPPSPAGFFTLSMEIALVGGTVVGLLLGIGAWCGLVTIRPMEADTCAVNRQA